MIHIYHTVNTSSTGRGLYTAADLSANTWSSPRSSILKLTLTFPNIPEGIFDTSKWQLIATIPSLPVDPLLYPELLI